MRLRMSLFVAVGMGIALLWYFFLITPAHQVQAQLQADLVATQIQMEDFQATLNQLPVFLQTRDGINRKITEINSHLYSRQEMLDLFGHAVAPIAAYGAYALALVGTIATVSTVLAL